MSTTEQRPGLRTPAGIKDFRVRHGLSQSELARALDVHSMTVARWEWGTTPIPKTTELALRYLEIGYGVDVSRL